MQLHDSDKPNMRERQRVYFVAVVPFDPLPRPSVRSVVVATSDAPVSLPFSITNTFAYWTSPLILNGVSLSQNHNATQAAQQLERTGAKRRAILSHRSIKYQHNQFIE
jgi:hypothetical protein